MKKRIVSVLLVLSMVLTLFAGMPMTAWSAEATADGYIEIYTVEDLYAVRNDLTANYILMNDIDLTEATAPGGDYDFYGNGWNPIGSLDKYSNGAFSGEFDGNGHSIVGMRIDVTKEPSGTSSPFYLGLFSNISGSVHDLSFEKCNITSSVTTTAYAGSLCGRSGTGTISDIATSTDISVTAGSGCVGGIAGYITIPSISKCYNTGKITGANAGGIVGFIYFSDQTLFATIDNCYNAGLIEGGVCSGGIVGDSEIGNIYSGGYIAAYGEEAKISTCYNVGKAEYGIGGYPVKITNCYYLNGSGASSTGATALSEAQMKLQSMYNGFDFEETWVIDANANYPYPQLRSNIQDLSEGIELVRIVTLPDKVNYLTDDALDLTNGILEVVYVSGRSELVAITDDMVSGFDPATVGSQELTVTYGGKTDSFTVTVKQRPAVEAVNIISNPTQKEFVVGTAFDFSGARMTIAYADGTMETINITEDMTTGGNINHIGQQTITVTYGGKSDTFTVNVVGLKVVKTEVASLPDKDEYLEGEALDLTGLALTVTMNNGKTSQITSGYTVSGYSSEPGTHTVTVTYQNVSTTFTVTVAAKSVTSLDLTSKPSKLFYYAGDKFDASGMVIHAVYDNGDVEKVTDYTISGFDSTAGLKVVTVSYGGKSVSFTVSVSEKILTDLEIKTLPAKTTYIEGESFDPAGLVVMGTYNNGSTEEIKDYALSGYSATAGTYTVSVTHDGLVAWFDVTVTAKKLVDIKITAPTKLNYYIGEAFDDAGMVVRAEYNNGLTEEIGNYTMSGFDSNTAGMKTVNVSFGGITKSFAVSVEKKAPVVTNGKIEVGSVKGRLGESVSVPVSVTNNNGVSGIRHTITFDATDLQFVSVEMNGDFAKGTLVVNDENAAKGEITIVWFNASDVKANGVMYTLSFEILEKATDGASAIEIAFEENDNGNAAGLDVLFTPVDGSVEVLSYWLGDLDGDRVYKMVDLLTLAQYVSGQSVDLTAKQKLAADVNEDGIIDIHDVTMLSQWLVDADF